MVTTIYPLTHETTLIDRELTRFMYLEVKKLVVHVTLDPINKPKGAKLFEIIPGNSGSSRDLDIYFGNLLIEISQLNNTH